jgi:hypothetical protein
MMIRAATVAATVLTLAGCGPVATAAPSVAVTATPASCAYHDGKAQRSCTPGADNPLVTKATLATTVCAPPVKGRKSWTQRQRPPTSYTDALKIQQMKQYGLTGSPADYEEDHLIPVSIGGAPKDPHNLAPELKSGPTGAKVKDKEELQLWHDVCAGMDLDTARTKIVSDWTWG